LAEIVIPNIQRGLKSALQGHFSCVFLQGKSLANVPKIHVDIILPETAVIQQSQEGNRVFQVSGVVAAVG
jgi:hypothetical protein